jgi:transposase
MRKKVSLSNAGTRWCERLRRWERSGLSITAFCHREGVSLPSFFQWRKRLQPGSARKGPGRAFVPVNIVANTELPAGPRLPAGGADRRVEVRCGSFVIEIPPGVDDSSVRQVLRLAREEAARC